MASIRPPLKLAGLAVFACATVAIIVSRSGPDGTALVRVGSGAGNNVTYLGCGCFWHVQHDLVTKVERTLLKRPGQALTAFTGYAGGRHTSEDGRVCYHSMAGEADYGKLGHAEVVSLDLPDAIAAMVAAVFFDETCVRGVRRDTQDWGAEYRSVVGFPGGINSHAGQEFSKAASARGIRLRAGAGNDGDDRGTVWVMDSSQFPYYQAEVYHQFHDDMTEAYGAAYNALRDSLLSAGRIHRTGCPRD